MGNPRPRGQLTAQRGHLRKEGEGRYCSRCDRKEGEGGDPTSPLDKLGKENMMGPPQEFDERTHDFFGECVFHPLPFLPSLSCMRRLRRWKKGEKSSSLRPFPDRKRENGTGRRRTGGEERRGMCRGPWRNIRRFVIIENSLIEIGAYNG